MAIDPNDPTQTTQPGFVTEMGNPIRETTESKARAIAAVKSGEISRIYLLTRQDHQARYMRTRSGRIERAVLGPDGQDFGSKIVG